jgi:hypothetical protein
MALRMFFCPSPLFREGGDCTSDEERGSERWQERLVTEAIGGSGESLRSRMGGKSEYSSDSDPSLRA